MQLLIYIFLNILFCVIFSSFLHLDFEKNHKGGIGKDFHKKN